MSFERLRDLLEEQRDTISNFTQNVDGRLGVLEDNLKALEKLTTRPGRGGDALPGDFSVGAREKLSQALREFIRSGDQALLETIVQGMSVGSNPDGGFTVVPVFSAQIMSRLRELSPIRAIARVITLPTGDVYEEPREDTEMDAVWVGEAQARPETSASKLGATSAPLCEIYGAPQVSQKALDTSSVDIAAWLGEGIADKFARAEGSAFVSGDGIGKPRGITTFPTAATADSSRPWGTFEHVATGASGAFATSDPADCLIDTQARLKSGYLPNAVWLMNRRTRAVVRKLKEQTTGNYLWQPGLGGQPESLLGHPIVVADDMPAIAADSLSIAFGDFGRGYTIVDGPGMRLLLDPYTAKPNVVFYAYKRVGGMVFDFDAIKFVKFGAS